MGQWVIMRVDFVSYGWKRCLVRFDQPFNATGKCLISPPSLMMM